MLGDAGEGGIVVVVVGVVAVRTSLRREVGRWRVLEEVGSWIRTAARGYDP
jgi:hypothetical protein